MSEQTYKKKEMRPEKQLDCNVREREERRGKGAAGPTGKEFSFHLLGRREREVAKTDTLPSWRG